jgi:hypothetical protein
MASNAGGSVRTSANKRILSDLSATATADLCTVMFAPARGLDVGATGIEPVTLRLQVVGSHPWRSRRIRSCLAIEWAHARRCVIIRRRCYRRCYRAGSVLSPIFSNATSRAWGSCGALLPFAQARPDRAAPAGSRWSAPRRVRPGPGRRGLVALGARWAAASWRPCFQSALVDRFASPASPSALYRDTQP